MKQSRLICWLVFWGLWGMIFPCSAQCDEFEINGYSAKYRKRYYTRLIETVSGTVADLEQTSSIRFTLKTKTETLNIQLNSTWFIYLQSKKIKEGDFLEIKGSRIELQGTPTIIAIMVVKSKMA